MNTLDIIALIAEPDAEVRMTSIKRLALLETQPKLNIIRVDIKEIKPSQFPNVAVSVILSTDDQVDITYDNIEQINKCAPKAAPVVPLVFAVCNKKYSDKFELSLNNGSSCLIDATMVNKLYNLANPPRAIPVGQFEMKRWCKNKGEVTKLELDCGDIVNLRDRTVIEIFNKIMKVENISSPTDQLTGMLDKLSNPMFDTCDIIEEYKQWRKENM